MERLLHAVLSNVGWAAALALGATLAGRIFPRRPALTHALWLLVLIKLVTPSLLQHRPERAAVPAIRLPESSRPVEVSQVDPTPESPAWVEAPSPGPVVETPLASEDQPGTEAWPWAMIAVAVWLTGSAAWWSVVLWQVSRFRRFLRAARPAPEPLCDRVSRLASRLGIRRGPTVWLVPARVPPLLWAIAGPPRLLLPEDLWARFDDDQRDSVLIHELAHLKRRDHWVRWLEAVVLGLYWWNPVAWWARRQVEESEERCCDAWVVWALPGAIDAYAEALVSTAVFLSGPRQPWPSGATGVRHVPPLRRRLNMLLRDPATGLMTRPGPRAALILGALCLPFLPGSAPGYPPEPARQVPAVEAGAAKPIIPAVAPATPDPAPVVAAPAPKADEAPDLKSVKVAQPIVREVDEYEDFTGRFEASQTVEIRARVGGILIKVHHRDGEMVEKGDMLFEIDPTIAEAELRKAEAEVERSEARLRRCIADKLRADAHLARSAIGREEFDRIEGDLGEASASCDAAKATREIARIKASSTRIAAPIRGMISIPRLSEGSLVVADATILGTIDLIHMMDVVFNIDEATALKLGRTKRENGEKASPLVGLIVRVGMADEAGFSRAGPVLSGGSRLEPGTGTLRCRAFVPNNDGLILPGMFARVRLMTGIKKTLLISERALRGIDPQRFLFIVNDRDFARMTGVKLGGLYDGLRAVKEGLKESDWVIVDRDWTGMDGTIQPDRVAMPTPVPKVP